MFSKNSIKLNNARNCLRLFLRSNDIETLYVPYELCSVIFKAIRSEGVNLKFYHIDENFMPACGLEEDAFILYPNYFGICDRQAKILANRYKNFIYDATQSLYSEPLGLATIYSLRKFLPLSDGGILVTNNDLCTQMDFSQEDDFVINDFSPLNFDYENFLKNELHFNRDAEMKFISRRSLELFRNADFEKDKALRKQRFYELHNIFCTKNMLDIPASLSAPMVYPLKTSDYELKEKIINSGIFLLKYAYIKDVLPLPLTVDIIEKISGI